MTDTLHQPKTTTPSRLDPIQERRQATFVPPPLPVATNEDVISYLRRSGKLGEIAAVAEQDSWVKAVCEQLNITVSDDEWQAAGDAFRVEHKLLGSAETFAWMDRRRTTVEDWSEGIKIELLTQKLQDYLVGATVDGAYMSDRDNYRRVALSQILVADLSTARSIVQKLQSNPAAFCSLALTHSKGKQSQENGGFVGIRFLVELAPDMIQAIRDAEEGDIVGPVQSRLGYHILKIEKWYPIELDEATRNQILNVLFQAWMQELDKTRNEKASLEPRSA